MVWTASNDDPVLEAVTTTGPPAAVHADPARPGLPSAGIDDRAAAHAVAPLALTGARRPAVLSCPLDRARRPALLTGPDPQTAAITITRNRLAGSEDAGEQTGGSRSQAKVAVCAVNSAAMRQDLRDHGTCCARPTLGHPTPGLHPSGKSSAAGAPGPVQPPPDQRAGALPVLRQPRGLFLSQIERQGAQGVECPLQGHRAAVDRVGEQDRVDEQPSRPGVGSDPAQDQAVAELDVEGAFKHSVDEGRRRLSRRTWPLLATGLLGGIDVGTGVLALLLVEHETGNVLLAGLAFSIGFIALSLANSELFTEDFLVPVTTVIARQARFRLLPRLWVGTLLANLVAGWCFTWLILTGFPQLGDTALQAGGYYVELGLGGRAFALAVIGGTVITLMTWMQHSTASGGLKLVPAVTGGFLLGAGQLNHVVVNSLLIFSALHTGRAPFGYLDWLQAAGLAAAGNMVGGLLLVTLLRLFQVPHTVRKERDNPALGVAIGDDRRAAARGQVEGP